MQIDLSREDIDLVCRMLIASGNLPARDVANRIYEQVAAREGRASATAPRPPQAPPAKA